MIDGEPEVEIEVEDIESEVDFWKTGLILFVVGKDLSMNAVKQFMVEIWNTVTLPDQYYHDDGYFIARFASVEDRDLIVMNGPYTIYNMPLFIRKWSPGFVLKDDLLRVMPIWVTFPSLPLHLWGKKNLSKIASAVGKPILADECTNRKLRVSYARVLIEIDITQQRKSCISIKDVDGKRFEQTVKYEWTPLFCQICQKVGHKCEKGKATKAVNENKEWRIKQAEVPVKQGEVIVKGSDPVKGSEADKENRKGVINQNVNEEGNCQTKYSEKEKKQKSPITVEVGARGKGVVGSKEPRKAPDKVS